MSVLKIQNGTHGTAAVRTACLLALVAMLLPSCSSGGSSAPAGLLAPVVELRQMENLPGVPDFRGEIRLRYVIDIQNRSGEQLNLQSITVRSVGSGAYVMTNTVQHVEAVIPPGARVEVPVALWVRGTGEFRKQEPVTLTGRLLFQTPVGALRHTFNQRLTQWRSGGL